MPTTYNEQAKQYEQDGKAIEAAVIVALVYRLTDRVKTKARQLSAKLEAGTITVDEWYRGMTSLLRSAHLTAAAVGKGGIDRLTPSDIARVNRKMAWQEGYLAKFRKAIVTGGVILGVGAIASRAAKYASAVFVSYSSAFRESQIEGKSDKMMCRLVQNSKEGCEECNDDAAAGWMPVDDMGEIGSRICGDYCLCQIEFEDEI